MLLDSILVKGIAVLIFLWRDGGQGPLCLARLYVDKQKQVEESGSQETPLSQVGIWIPGIMEEREQGVLRKEKLSGDRMADL